MKRPMASLAALGAVAALWSAVPAGAQPAPVEPRIAGVWVLAPASSPPPALTPAGQAARDANRASLAPGAVSLDPTAQCLPMGFPRNMATHFPIQIVQTPGQVTMIFQAGIRVRRVFTDGRPHDAELDPSYNGDSVGRWDGDTLVVETRNLKDTTWLDHDGTPRGEGSSAVERIRLSADGKTLFDEIAVTDPKVLAQPWVVRRQYERAADAFLSDYICVEHGKGNPAWVSTDGAATLHRR